MIGDPAIAEAVCFGFDYPNQISAAISRASVWVGVPSGRAGVKAEAEGLLDKCWDAGGPNRSRRRSIRLKEYPTRAHTRVVRTLIAGRSGWLRPDRPDREAKGEERDINCAQAPPSLFT